MLPRSRTRDNNLAVQLVQYTGMKWGASSSNLRFGGAWLPGPPRDAYGCTSTLNHKRTYAHIHGRTYTRTLMYTHTYTNTHTIHVGIHFRIDIDTTA